MNDVEHQGEASPPADSSPHGKIRWTAGVPRWVKVFVVTALGLALLMVVVMLVSGGQHGPGRGQPAVAGQARQHPVRQLLPLPAAVRVQHGPRSRGARGRVLGDVTAPPVARREHDGLGQSPPVLRGPGDEGGIGGEDGRGR